MVETLIRRAASSDVDLILGLLDDVIAWFVSIGNTGQWGSEPWSTSPKQRARIEDLCAAPDSWVAERDGSVVGALWLGDAVDYVPAATEPELYVRVLIGSRGARGVGAELMAFAEHRAQEEGVPLMRVDCYGGGSGKLVEFYEERGFTRTVEFEIDGWPGQVLEKRLA